MAELLAEKSQVTQLEDGMGQETQTDGLVSANVVDDAFYEFDAVLSIDPCCNSQCQS